MSCKSRNFKYLFNKGRRKEAILPRDRKILMHNEKFHFQRRINASRAVWGWPFLVVSFLQSIVVIIFTKTRILYYEHREYWKLQTIFTVISLLLKKSIFQKNECAFCRDSCEKYPPPPWKHRKFVFLPVYAKDIDWSHHRAIRQFYLEILAIDIHGTYS